MRYSLFITVFLALTSSGNDLVKEVKERDWNKDGVIDTIETSYRLDGELIQLSMKSLRKGSSSCNFLYSADGTRMIEEDYDLDGHFEVVYTVPKGAPIEDWRPYLRLKDNTIRPMTPQEAKHFRAEAKQAGDKARKLVLELMKAGNEEFKKVAEPELHIFDEVIEDLEKEVGETNKANAPNSGSAPAPPE